MADIRQISWGIVLCVTLGLSRGVLAQPPPAQGGRAAAQATVPAGNAAKPSQRISLDLKGVDIIDVLKLLSQKSGLNFIAGRNVSGRVTIFVNDVDVWEAFELIVSANDLAYERQAGIVTVMMARDYELLYGEKFQQRTQDVVLPLRYAKSVQVAAVLNQVKSTVGRVVVDEPTNTLILSDVPAQLDRMKELLKELDRPIETRVYPLNYVEAEKLKEKVQELLSPVGTFTFDARTNQAIVSDLREVLPKVDQVIRAFDVPDAQVLIESRIINVTLTDNSSLGINWSALLSGVDISARNNFLSRDVVKTSIFAATDPSLGSGLLLTSTKGPGAIIEALKNLGRTETLSNPRIVVANNQEAKILVGSKEPFVTTTTTIPSTGSQVNAPQVQFQDVGTKLFVTPNIKRDGYVQLKIRPEVSSARTPITSIPGTIIPVIQTTEAETNVLVKSGVTLIIAGLIDTKDEVNDSRTPWLGNLPIIGLPFRSSTTQQRKSELVIFLTPQIVLPDGSPYFPPSPSVAAEAVTGPSGEPLPEVVLQDPVPAAYRQAIRQRLQAHLISQFRTASLPAGSVTVAFILNHDGRLLGEGEIASPQGAPFVAAARAALQAAQPFPSFPEGADASEVRFRLAAEYSP